MDMLEWTRGPCLGLVFCVTMLEDITNRRKPFQPMFPPLADSVLLQSHHSSHSCRREGPFSQISRVLFNWSQSVFLWAW